jgi:branched-chain amino acid transport system permease protein
MLYCFLGGLNYLMGPILGAFLLTFSFEGLRFIQKYQEGIYAGLMIIFIIWLPNGLMSLKLKKQTTFKNQPYYRNIQAYVLEIVKKFKE